MDDDRPASIQTERLELIALTPREIRALISGETALAGRLVGADFPSGWPDDRDARDGLAWHLRGIEESIGTAATKVRSCRADRIAPR